MVTMTREEFKAFRELYAETCNRLNQVNRVAFLWSLGITGVVGFSSALFSICFDCSWIQNIFVMASAGGTLYLGERHVDRFKAKRFAAIRADIREIYGVKNPSP